jgi:hypothetical protein
MESKATEPTTKIDMAGQIAYLKGSSLSFDTAELLYQNSDLTPSWVAKVLQAS